MSGAKDSGRQAAILAWEASDHLARTAYPALARLSPRDALLAVGEALETAARIEEAVAAAAGDRSPATGNAHPPVNKRLGAFVRRADLLIAEAGGSRCATAASAGDTQIAPASA